MNPTAPLFRRCLAACLFALPVSQLPAQTVDIFRIGIDNDTQSEFAQENPSLADYYYDNGDYFDLGGLEWVSGQEPFDEYPRAFTKDFTATRIFFQLDPLEADSATIYTLSLETIDTRIVDGLQSLHDLEFLMNDVFVGEALMQANGEISFTFDASDVDALPGANVIEIRWLGAELPWLAPGEVGVGGLEYAWIQFDFINLTADVSAIPCTDPICTFGSSAVLVDPGQEITLSWLASPSSSLVLGPETGNVDANTAGGIGSITLVPTQNTTYELMTDNGGGTVRTVEVNVRNILSFTTADLEVDSGGSALLAYAVDPSATLTIEPDVGAVASGTGEVEVTPEVTTTYTLTSSRGNDVETRELTVSVPLIFEFTATDYRLKTKEGETEVTLDWTTDAGATVTLEPGFGTVDVNTVTLAPTETTTYTLTATLGENTVQRTLDVIVSDLDPFLVFGVDNGNTSELEQETTGMEAFYVENGDYFDLGGDEWFDGPEPLTDGVLGEPGFPRALTSVFPEFSIYFQLDEDQVSAGTEFEFFIEFIEPRAHEGLVSTHDIEFEWNGTNFGGVQGISTGLYAIKFTADSVGAVAGPNALTLFRADGFLPWPTDGSTGTPSDPNIAWIQFDLLELGISGEPVVSPPTKFFITEVSTDPFALTFESQIGATYTVQSSPDLGSWTNVETGFPAGGATAALTTYSDLNPVAPGMPMFFRVVRE